MTYIAPRQAGEEHRRITFVLAWSSYKVGDQIVPPASLRSMLLSKGYAVATPAPYVSQEAVAREDRMMAAKGKRGARYATRA